MILSPLLDFRLEIPFLFTPGVCMFIRLNIHKFYQKYFVCIFYITRHQNRVICPTVTLRNSLMPSFYSTKLLVYYFITISLYCITFSLDITGNTLNSTAGVWPHLMAFTLPGHLLTLGS